MDAECAAAASPIVTNGSESALAVVVEWGIVSLFAFLTKNEIRKCDTKAQSFY